MCNLYSMTSNQEAIRRLFQVVRNTAGNLPSMSAVYPGFDAPVVRRDADGERELATMSWGFVLPQKGKAPKRVNNTRNDKALASPFWKNSFTARRCLVPATSFCEWTDSRPKVPHWFAMAGGGRPLFAFAGLWRSWKGVLKETPVELDVFSILTTAPNAIVAPIHSRRMPVILRPQDYELYLTGPAEDALALATPYAADAMTIVHTGETKDEHVAA